MGTIARLVGTAVSAAASCIVVMHPAAAAGCSSESLSALGIPQFSVMSASRVAAEGPSPGHCKVKGSVATDGEGAGPNSARVEINLPDDWNGKFVFFGVGGLAGSLMPSANPHDVASALSRGYATAITDTGHQGSNPFDAGWILEAPGKPNDAKVIDYFYRAAHQATGAAKSLVATYYGVPKVSRAYFDGCSWGGHMGLMEAMRYPDDYDGVIAGAPYMDNHTQLWGYKNAKAFLNAYVPADVVAKVNETVLATCDATDGVKDGLIQNPAKCDFDPQSLVPATLTQAQADAFKVFIRATTDARGHPIYPGSPSTDLVAADGPAGGFMGWVESVPPSDLAGAEPWGSKPPVLWAAAEGFTKSFDLRDPGADLNRDWPETDGQVAADALEQFDERLGVADVNQPERLAQFLQQGKKLILYHGYGDTAISPYRTVWFYEDLAAKLGGYDKAKDQVRLFMAPGMLHCFGGDGPNDFDTLGALEDWVEKGKAPNGIVAAKYPDNKPGPAPLRTMPLCAFPAQARYKGVGEVNDATNWTCPEDDAAQLEVGADGVAAGMGLGRR
jgi:feruloyl esterase